jgi:hypothetical protein
MRREDRAGGNVNRQQREAGGEHRTHDFVEFEGIHRGSALAERGGC